VKLPRYVYVSSTQKSSGAVFLTEPDSSLEHDGRAWARLAWNGSTVRMDELSDLTQVPIECLPAETRILFFRASAVARIAQACHRLESSNIREYGLLEATLFPYRPHSVGRGFFSPHPADPNAATTPGLDAGSLDEGVLLDTYGRSCAYPYVAPASAKTPHFVGFFSPNHGPNIFGAPYLSPATGSHGDGWELHHVGMIVGWYFPRTIIPWNDHESLSQAVETVKNSDIDTVRTSAYLVNPDSFSADVEAFENIRASFNTEALPG
jgi:hypothetical protein